MRYFISEKVNLTETLCTKVGDIYTSCGWGNDYKWESIKSALLNTDYYRLILNESGHPVGLLRAFSDTIFATWLAELLVKKEHQGKGVGMTLLNQFSKDFKHTAIYVLPLKGTERFFEKAGIIQREKLLASSRRAY